jgi:DNA polymerase-3 subunit epsilon
MNRMKLFWLFVAASVVVTFVVIASLAVLFWQQLTPEDQAFLTRMARQNLGFIFSVAVLLLAGLGFGLDWMFRLYILPLDKLTEAVRLIHSVNPAHRIQLEGGRDIVRLAETINAAADRYEELHRHVQSKIQLARADAEEEKNILAAIMEELPEGVLICNADGQILLYNKRARQFLVGSDPIQDLHDNGPATGRFLGLGRSLFGLIDKNQMVHALDEIADKLQRAESDVAAYFVIVGHQEALLRVETLPILTPAKDFTGFILIFTDITRQLESESKMDFLLRSLARDTRSSLASIRAAIEAILEYPSMDSRQLQQFKEIIHRESISLGDIIKKTTAEYSKRLRSRWPLVRTPARDLLDTVVKRAGEKLGLTLTVAAAEDDCWIHVDSYSLLSAILFLQQQLKESTGCREFVCLLSKEGRFVRMDFTWPGQPVKPDRLRRWEEEIVKVKDEILPSTLKEVILHHDAELWSYSCDQGRRAYLRLLFPTVDAPATDHIRNLTILPRSRPEFFDFDLFNQPGQRPELDNRRLSDLSYTVFDTETTGLNPQGGDEIISIGAVRIVNSHLLREDVFDQLVDPRREIPPESTDVHGITAEMCSGQPTIEKVLPRFYQYSDDTILVGHNAAFDMRMLQLKESITGVVFTNPVIDTMLLSAVVHPGQQDHNLESIARRLGVNILGRHTALGDAIATGEIFLKLIPLLEQQGVTTLKEARNASRKTYYSRLKY